MPKQVEFEDSVSRPHLGINTGFAVNRYSSPDQWIPLVGEVLGLKTVQFTADLLNPSLPDKIIDSQINLINQLQARHSVSIQHTFTGAYTRVNHLSHPNSEMREYWVHWFKRFVNISVRLGAISMGSHFGILTAPDLADADLRAARFRQTVEGWLRIGEYAAAKGLRFLTWEPMSIPREYGETIEEAQRVHSALGNSAIPFKYCIDVDHGDVSSSNSEDTDPYAWLRAFGSESPIIHIKQSSSNKGGHWPFTAKHNKTGRIKPTKLISALRESGAKEVTLLLELSFRERQPFDSRVVEDIIESVDYWRPYVTI
jgi:sugar phosphate isomerase/epimerase